MKRIVLPLLVLAVWLAPASPVSAQLRFGIKAGACFSDLSLSHGFDANSVSGFTGGVMTELMLPVFGIGFDASLMYARKGFTLTGAGAEEYRMRTKRLDYLDIPVNFKWKIGIPLVKLFLTTGPNFGFLLNSNFKNRVKKHDFDLGWNLGAGVELLRKIQVAAAYSWGLTNAIDLGDGVKGKNRGWTLTAAYLF